MIPMLVFAALQAVPQESRYYRLEPVEQPAELVLEVSGITLLEDGRPMICTRRGEVYIVDNAYGEPGTKPVFHLYAQGLQEPLGLLPHEGWIYVAQRAELSRMRDIDGDDRADELETVCDDWNISGNYHEYLFGPVLDREGNFWVTSNRPFGDQPFGSVKWRGFALRITPQGAMQPVCAGLRSPCGVATSPDGEIFYSDNQGEWCGTSKLSLLEEGMFYGHPWGVDSCKDPLWKFADPGHPKNEVLMTEVSKQIPSFRLPAVWFPYDKMGRSPSGFVWDQAGGRFGPFAHQIFIGDQYQSSVMRVALEKVDGRWQGACFPFRVGLASGVVRVGWGKDGSLFCGETNRGWGSLGPKSAGLERLVWTGEMPFEILALRASPDGFDLDFTQPIDPASAADLASYSGESYTYLLHETYGSDEVEKRPLHVSAARVAPDGKSVHIAVDGRRAGYVHELHVKLRSAEGEPLLHDAAYYTLNAIPR
ncbi:MAG: hypothetical protein IPJ19_07790 [Planctomycetes bacterium]|nr:hypothetical protein [Planctomycetota bacterium]